MRLCQKFPLQRITVLASVIAVLASGSAAQEATLAPAGKNDQVSVSLIELQSEVSELKELVQQLTRETVASRTEITRLRQELESERAGQAASSADGMAPETVDVRIGHLEEEQQLLTGKVDEQYQTKLESASRYRVRFSGIALLNLFSTQGSVDSIDVPELAYRQGGFSSSGSFGGTLRQSSFGFEVFGPQLMGARSSGDITFDAGAGFPYVSNGVNFGLVRMRTAGMRLDWKDTSLVMGQEALFFQPNSPTSFASLLVPALSYSGNLWAWTPQIHVDHRFALTKESTLSVQGGILDNLTGEPPYGGYVWYRTPQAGERSRQPAYAGRVAYSRPFFGRTFTIGAAGYYSRENWGYGRDVNGYAAMADWTLPLSEKLALSGSFYRGQAIGGLGGGIGRSVLYNGPLADSSTSVIPLNVVGGWTQLKYRAAPKLEFNAAYGEDDSFAADLHAFEDPQSYGDPRISRNQGAFANVIYRPRSDVLFSLEYRHLTTYSVYETHASAGQVNLAMGILF